MKSYHVELHSLLPNMFTPALHKIISFMLHVLKLLINESLQLLHFEMHIVRKHAFLVQTLY